MLEEKYNFHILESNLWLYQKGIYFAGIKVFSNLPQSIKDLSNDAKQFNQYQKVIYTLIPFSRRWILQYVQLIL
jgi:hypothetical protein